MKKRKNDHKNDRRGSGHKADADRIDQILEAKIDRTQWRETKALTKEVRGALSDAMDLRAAKLAELILDIGALDQHGLACSRCLGLELEELSCRTATLATKIGALAACAESTTEDKAAAPLLAAASDLAKAMDVFGDLAMKWLRPDVAGDDQEAA